MIVVEGPDGAGKTTLMRDLVDDFGLEIAKRQSDSVLGPLPLKDAITHDMGRGHSRGRIHDRYGLISEPIYGPICRGKLQEGFDDRAFYMRAWSWFITKQPFIIFCLPPLEAVRRNVGVYDPKKAKDQMPGVVQNIDGIYAAYKVLAWRWLSSDYTPCIIFDYTGTVPMSCAYPAVAQDVQAYMKDRNFVRH